MEVKLAALMLKNVALDSAATALALQEEINGCDSTEDNEGYQQLYAKYKTV